MRIRGPKNLWVDGREFYIDEKSLTLRSARPISFRWEGHSGHASGGIEIQLAGDTHNPGLVDISDIRSVQLRGRVTCDLHFPARRVGDEAVNLEVTAANGFEFDLHSGLGTFFGYPNRRYDRENQVLVKRRTAGESDLLQCAQLNVEFHPEISPETGLPVKSRRRLARVMAQGSADRPVVYVSPEHQIGATMSRLEYFVAERRLEMSMAGATSDGRPLPVKVWQTDPTNSADSMTSTHAGRMLELYPSAQVSRDSAKAPRATIRILHGEGSAVERKTLN